MFAERVAMAIRRRRSLQQNCGSTAARLSNFVDSCGMRWQLSIPIQKSLESLKGSFVKRHNGRKGANNFKLIALKRGPAHRLQ